MEHFRPLFFVITMFMVTACGGGGGGADSTNSNPTANAGSDQVVTENGLVQLAGTGNDTEGAVTFSWTQTSGITVILSDATIASPTFTAPMVFGNEALGFALSVTDTDGNITTDTIVITVNDSAGNNSPIVDAGPDQSRTEGATVQLAGLGSDAEGAVTFNWTQTSGISVTLSDASIANSTFVAPMVSGSEALGFTLAVTDTNGATTTDTIVITVNDSAGNSLPIVDAGPDQSRTEGATVQLAGLGSDAEGAVTFSWTQTSGTSVILSGTTIANPTFVAPMVTSTEVLVFALTVTDAAMASVMDSVSIAVTDSVTAVGGTYLFYAKGLNAVDPANPGFPTEIEPAANLVTASDFTFYTTPREIETGTYDSTTGILTDLHSYAVIYAHTDGNIYKVSALKSGSLAPVRVSSESMADQLCTDSSVGDPARADFDNADNSQFIYALPGGDGVCNTSDDVWKMVRLGMGETDAPVIAKPPVQILTDPATGAISGWLVHDAVAGELQRCDASFAGCSAITMVSDSVSELRGSARFIPLELDNLLLVYDVDADTLSSAVFTIPAGTYLDDVVSDSNTTYFAYDSSIYQFPVDGSSVATVLLVESSDIQRLTVNDNNLVYQLGSGGPGTEIKSVPKAGGTPTSLVTATGTDTLSQLFVKNNRVYYNILNNSVPVAAGVIDDDGLNQTETMTAAWIGAVFATTLDTNNIVIIGDLIEKVIRIEGYDIVGTGGGYAGATLKSVDAVTSLDIATLGTLPTADHLPSLSCYGFGDDRLCPVGVTLNPPPASPASPTQLDVFYLNASTANSLTRVTNTPSETEVPIQ
ncbi:MAG: hypothetical protein GXP17_08325 [Gammaproteobacteria bacterium]|nr:hypothetical protein [Gammaproteobacteria bacterium]